MKSNCLNFFALLAALLLLSVGTSNADTMQWSANTSRVGYEQFVADDSAFFFLNQQNVSQLSLVTGNVMWTTTLSPKSTGMTMIVDGGASIVVLFGGDFVTNKTYQMFGLSRTSGAVLWETTVKPTNDTGPLQLDGIPSAGVVAASWLDGTLAPGQQDHQIELQTFNATTGKMMWNYVPEVSNLVVLPNGQNAQYAIAQVTNNGLVFNIGVEVDLFFGTYLFSADYVVDVVSGKLLLFLNNTGLGAVWSNLDANSPFIANIAQLQDNDGSDYVVNLYNATASALQSSFKFSAAKHLSNDNTTLIVAKDMLLVACYPDNGQPHKKWIAAFDITTNAPLWNVTLPQSVSGVQQAYLMHGNNIVLTLGGATFSYGDGQRFGPVQFVAFNRKTGHQAWTIAAPTIQDYSAILRATNNLNLGADIPNGLVIPNMMGWTRWVINDDESGRQLNSITPILQYNTLTVLRGVTKMLPAPLSSTDFIVMSKENVARYTPSSP